jgi:glutamate racemase
VGIIGTEATVRSNAYTRAIHAVDRNIEVFGLACPLFVPLVEEGWTEGNIPALIAREYLSRIQDKGIDTVVLGCTHYPLLKTVISEVMGEKVRLIDSAVEISYEIKATLEALGMKREQRGNSFRKLFVTDSPERFLKVGEKFLGQRVEHIDTIEVGG